jgi:hypothetical protein
MSIVGPKIGRRRVLQGALGGGTVAVALPLLDCCFNDNGSALAATGRMPVRFGTWNWGCGVTAARWFPTKLGTDYDVPAELKPMEALKRKVTVLSGFKAMLDGRQNLPHVSGIWSLRTGTAPTDLAKLEDPSLDIAIADVMGAGTRFRSLELTATGNPAHTYSRRNASTSNPSETSPLAFYTRVFGPEFQDPNAASFTPDPNIMLRRSVLSAVAEHRAALLRDVGQADKARLDQYFTSVRQLEQQLELQLQKPPPAESCAVPSQPKEMAVGSEIEQVMATHKLMAQLLAMALACNQTKVFNMVFSDSLSSLRRAGSAATHHTLTHEEPIDEKLGYQPQATYFVERSMEAWGSFLATLDAIPEGDGTLLDHCLVFAHTDTQFAKIHSVDGIPLMLAGSGAGKVKTGLHLDGNGDPITRVGLTVQQLMGVAIDKWGTASMATSKPISELIA